MARFTTLEERQRDRRAAEVRKAARIAAQVARSRQQKAAQRSIAPPSAPVKGSDGDATQHMGAATVAVPATPPEPTPLPAWRTVRQGSGGLAFTSRTNPGQQVQPQPWLRALVNDLLAAASDNPIKLRLIWPAPLPSAAPIHALAQLERMAVSDLRGLRTLLYPGTHTSTASLQRTLTLRPPLAHAYSAMWDVDTTVTRLRVATQSPAMEAVFATLTNIERCAPDVAPPSLAELIPSFISQDGTWATAMTPPLERSLRKVSSRSYRTSLREKVQTGWGQVQDSPGALLVLHRTTGREQWRSALASCGVGAIGTGGVEVMLIDALNPWAGGRAVAVKRIPEFLAFVRTRCGLKAGALVVTDNPGTFAELRYALTRLKLDVDSGVYASEGPDVDFSAAAFPDGWTASPRSVANFSVHVVDREASLQAVEFYKLANLAGAEGHAGHDALLATGQYLVWLASVPAGFSDLNEMAIGFDEFAARSRAWTTVQDRVEVALASGALNDLRAEVGRSMAAARSLVASCMDGTPMALRLLRIVEKLTRSKGPIAVVLGGANDIALAHRFLARRLDANTWENVEPRIEWHTLGSIRETLAQRDRHREFIFAGVNANVLRVLTSHPDLPNGTNVLFSFRQASTLLKALAVLMEPEALKPYRGRMGPLLEALERALDQFGPRASIEKLADLPLVSSFDATRASAGGEHTDNEYRFDLEDGRRIYSASRVFRYEPDEDPCFKPLNVERVERGDMVFDMSEALRTELEAALSVNGQGWSSLVDPRRMMLKLYHNDVERRVAALFPDADTRAARATAIRERMVELDATASKCTVQRLTYWLAYDEEKRQPHGPSDHGLFLLFCRALAMDVAQAENYWGVIRGARAFNQSVGRALAAQYTEILFQPETAMTYRLLSTEVVKQLQQEALGCVYRVIEVTPPSTQTPVQGPRHAPC